MADHFVSLSRGEQGFMQSDFNTGVASNAGDTIELRIRDGAQLTRKDVDIAIEAFERFFQTTPWVVAAGFDVAL